MLEENFKTLEFKLTFEQMKRLDEASKPTEIAFPYSLNVCILDKHLGKTLKFQKKSRVHTILEN
ncbi:hypothetical protein RhiirA4_479737 [Rhizophagus irregularis]|uniref:Uncharacterized protein n=1 Tax=Rhizophagus irregularis TaxID=588596 RepID=A0A2I1HGV0_9GLOM|nr:hypothetical protein RhiirA4_479737 [Rhizophagus irregularis]